MNGVSKNNTLIYSITPSVLKSSNFYEFVLVKTFLSLINFIENSINIYNIK